MVDPVCSTLWDCIHAVFDAGLHGWMLKPLLVGDAGHAQCSARR
jgi:hypothetical protein